MGPYSAVWGSYYSFEEEQPGKKGQNHTEAIHNEWGIPP